MKHPIHILLMCITLLSGCNRQSSDSDKLLDKIEKIIETNPDSALSILKGISSPEELDNRTFARWCMLSGKVTDEVFNDLLPTYQFEKAYDWYSSHGTPDEQVQILIYLGRSHFAEGDYDKAMSIYTNALDVAEKRKLNNRTGYIYCYIGDLYREKFMLTEAIKRYLLKKRVKKFLGNIPLSVSSLPYRRLANTLNTLGSLSLTFAPVSTNAIISPPVVACQMKLKAMTPSHDTLSVSGYTSKHLVGITSEIMAYGNHCRVNKCDACTSAKGLEVQEKH